METYATENLNIEIVEKRKHTMTSTIERFSQVERLAGRIKSSYCDKINDVYFWIFSFLFVIFSLLFVIFSILNLSRLIIE